MMKKLLLLSSAMFVLSFAAMAQGKELQINVTKTGSSFSSPGNPSYKTTAFSDSVWVTDTLHYYLNKFYFKTATTQFTNFPYHISAAATVSTTTHCGSRIDVPAGETVTVTGLEAFAQKVPGAVHLEIPVRLMLCNLNAQGMPILPPIDSVEVNVGGPNVIPIGGDLTAPRTMTADFAILFRNVSTSSGDYVRLLRTSSTTETNTTAPLNTKYSDYENGKGYGYVRFNGTFYSTRDFTLAAGFGAGTAYEFVVAPRVHYQIRPGQIVPSYIVTENDSITIPDTICTRNDMVFTNTSSKFFEHRMYNLNQFYRKWNLGSPFPAYFANVFEADSSITWNFEFFDNPSYTDSRVFLPYVNTGSISVITDLSYYPDCFENNEFRARLKPMGALGKVPQLKFNEKFEVCLRYCNGDDVGIPSLKNYEDLKVYPNPTINGKTIITGLTGKNTIVVYNMLGQQILSEKSENSNFELDLLKQPKGTYLVRIANSNNQVKIVKIVKQD